MNQPIPTGPDLFGFAEAAYDKARAAGQKPGSPIYGSLEELYQFRAADFHAKQAQTAAIVMLTEVIANATGTGHDDLDAWREKIGMTWRKECRGEVREADKPVSRVCRCGHSEADHDAEWGDPQCSLCPGDEERSWRHRFTPVDSGG